MPFGGGMARFWRTLADCVLDLHLLFILWAIFGAVVARNRPLSRFRNHDSHKWGENLGVYCI